MVILLGEELEVRTRYVNRVLKSSEKVSFQIQEVGDNVKVSLKLGALQQSFIYINKKNSTYNRRIEAQRDLLCRFCVEKKIDIAI